ncbi:MAG: hypothetical protein ACJ786_15800 [Catenulispora sp.]
MRDAQLANANPHPMNATYVARVAAGSPRSVTGIVLWPVLTGLLVSQIFRRAPVTQGWAAINGARRLGEHPLALQVPA